MAEFIVIVVRQAVASASASAGPSVAVVKISAGTINARPSPAALSIGSFQTTELTELAQTIILLPGDPCDATTLAACLGALPPLHGTALAPPAATSIATPGTQPRSAIPIEPSPDASARHRMPGWLTARAAQQAVLAGRTSRTQVHAGSRRIRPVDRPARRQAAPRRFPTRTVVWMAAR